MTLSDGCYPNDIDIDFNCMANIDLIKNNYGKDKQQEMIDKATRICNNLNNDIGDWGNPKLECIKK